MICKPWLAAVRRFLRSRWQSTETVLSDMLVHLFGMLYRTLLNAAHTVYVLILFYFSFYSLSLSFLVEEAGHHSNAFQEVPESSWISYKQMPLMNFQESDPGGLQCFAEPVKSETSGRSPVVRSTSGPDASTTRRWPLIPLAL